MEKLEKLKGYRNEILLAEIGALIHDLGKLSEFFLRKQSEQEKDKYSDYHHSRILDYDCSSGNKYSPKASRTKELSNDVKQKLMNEKIDILNGDLLDIIEEHHDKNSPKNDLVRLIIASDEFDSEEDRGKAKDKQNNADNIFKATAFGIESKETAINLANLEVERQKVYELLINFFDEKIERRELLDKLKDCFSKTLGMTARAANDVTLWDHSYMTASIMKALVAYRVLNPGFVLDSKKAINNVKPFKIFAVGWSFFDFIKQSHKIPDVIGRIRLLNEIKEDIKKIVEEEYALGNSIYEDDFGIYFLIPSVLDENDLKKIKEMIFNTFNDKTNGILLPIFHLEKPKTNDVFRIGKLLTGAMKNVKDKIANHLVELFNTPAWIKDRISGNVTLSEGKLVCNVCGMGFYSKEDDEKICKICKEIRNKGRKKDSLQTIFIDEIAWNPSKKKYENICLLIAKFDLEEWLNGKYINSLFVRSPNLKKLLWLKNFYNSNICKDKENNLILDNNAIKRALSLGAVNGYLKSQPERARKKALNEIKNCLNYYNSLDDFSKKLLKSVKENLEKAEELVSSINNKINELQKIFEELKRDKVIKRLNSEISEFEKDILTPDNSLKKKEKQTIKNNKIEEILQELFQKPTSPSRLMRMWYNTANFFNMIANEIGKKAPNVTTCNIVVGSFSLKRKKLIEGLAYVIEIPKVGVSGEVICEKNCGNPIRLRVITPHLAEYLKKNKCEVTGAEAKIYHSERKDLIAIATISDIISLTSDKSYRIISTSSSLFIAIIPAEISLDVVKIIKREYERYFGKVFGKLPLHVGLIYFKRKMPIFAILDSANRMLDEFEKLSKSDSDNYIRLHVISDPVDENNYDVLELSPIEEEKRGSFKYKIKIPYKLGDGTTDYYHPYLIVESSNDGIRTQINEKTIIAQKHISKIKKGDIVKVRKYFFDFVFLDSNIRRFDVGRERKHWLFIDSTNKPKPYLLWDIDNFEKLQELIIKKLELTTTQVMNLYEMLTYNIEEWNLKNVEKLKKDEVFKKLIDNAIKSIPLRLSIVEGEKLKKDKIAKEDYEFLKDSILNGMFFDFVDLWYTVLKKKFKEGV